MDKQEVKFLTSLALAVNDIDDVVKHLQFTVCQDVNTKEIKCFFDVVDPSKVKLADELH